MSSAYRTDLHEAITTRDVRLSPYPADYDECAECGHPAGVAVYWWDAYPPYGWTSAASCPLCAGLVIDRALEECQDGTEVTVETDLLGVRP
ncbi:hypothetical protein SAMN04487905_10658 [Actinopolyspora xinjiangensis]|uniref:Uncharacterized protein n=1 Tax=Actinopolyspora xinjiangensis TaxID=405564 RepID=A0A1H0U5I6_9ACTN|nr:hypothetical protein [Actinopolyspora xinjiangensis]SDP61330.1 hypothetical protein SAMN04487905_10658 [Actinopolyspora xinjiangensis]